MVRPALVSCRAPRPCPWLARCWRSASSPAILARATFARINVLRSRNKSQPSVSILDAHVHLVQQDILPDNSPIRAWSSVAGHSLGSRDRRRGRTRNVPYSSTKAAPRFARRRRRPFNITEEALSTQEPRTRQLFQAALPTFAHRELVERERVHLAPSAR